jgi:predicted permease
MPASRESLPDRLFQTLLRLLPFDFRSEFGSDMEETFRQQRAETESSHRPAALLRMWWATIVDIVGMAPREHLSVIAQDSRYALRMMRKNPGYTIAAIVILGLGIGVNTSIFSMVNSILLKPLPYLQGDRLVVLHQEARRAGVENMLFSVAEINDYRNQNKTVSGLVEYHTMTFTLLGGSEPHRVRTGVVSAGFFDLFGVQPLMGRTFVPGDDRPGAQPVLVLSYEFWKQAERGDPGIVGRKYQMNDKPHTVVGVLPPIPQYPNENDVYMPTVACPFRSSARTIANRGAHMMSVFARLKPEATPDLCRADMAVIARRLKQDYPKFYPEEAGYAASASVLRDDLTRQARPMLLVLLGAAVFVLLIACANVANLILARMARREQELVIRAAVGAGSGRLLRQLLTESLILALLAGLVGLLLAAGSLRLLAQFAGQLTPRAREIGVDGRVLAFALFCAGATTIVFGSVAALFSRHDVAHGLKEGSRAGAEKSRSMLRKALITAQVAFSYVLLIGSGLMVRSFLQLDRVNPGFAPERVFAVGIDPPWSKYTTWQQSLSLSDRLLEKLQTQPGITSVAVASSFPLDPDAASLGGWESNFQIEGQDPSTAGTIPRAAMRVATPDYFRTLGIPLVSGRTFTDFDRRETLPVAVISRSLALHRWGQQEPIGKRVTFDRGDHFITIVGVVGDVKEFSLDHDAPDQIYRPMAQLTAPGTVLVRTAAGPSAMAATIRRLVREVDPEMAITNTETLEQARQDAVRSPRATARLFGLYAGLAFVIAITGIAFMLALWVRQRTRELGIRMALGASPSGIVGIVIRQGMGLVAAGLAIGFAGSLAFTDLLKALLFQVTPTDTPTYVLVSVFLAGAALLASYVPARRAAGIDPQEALRCE